MLRIPKMFSSDKKAAGGSVGGGGNDPKFKAKPRPRLERRNAKKNIDYELRSTSSSDDYSFSSTSASDFPSAPASPAQRTRSLDIYPLDKHTSFRIKGNCPGEFEIICKSLGLSGPEDFAIPAAAWENMKVRSSSSDVLPRLSRFNYDGGGHSVDEINRKIESTGSKDNACRVSDVISSKAGIPNFCCSPDSTATPRVIDVINPNTECSGLQVLEAAATPARCSSDILRSDKVSDILRSDKVDFGPGSGGVRRVRSSHDRVLYNFEEAFIKNEGGNDLDSNDHEGMCYNRIKGERPPPLAPPPGMSLPPVDSVCSSWDILKLFAPDDDNQHSSRSENCEAFSSNDEESGRRDEDEGEDEEEVHYVVASRSAGGESGLLSESCSFTTNSNDDDSSSTTTEPLSNISPNGRFRRIISYWDKGELLGRGSFGSVYEGMADGGFFFAVKEVSLLDQGEAAKQCIYQLEQEIALLSQFEHENIVQYYGTDKDESKLYIFLELVTKGSLLSLYQKYHLRDSQVSAYTRQILHGLKYLHDQNVVHRDIKCANILVDASGFVKLADFGLAKATKLNDVKSCKGTALWMAPEVVNRRNQGYGLAADIWSLGCTVLEMSTGQFPYSHLESMQALYRIGKGEPPRVPESLSRDVRDFILQCLQVNPNSRPTASQLLDHPFVQKSLPLSGST